MRAIGTRWTETETKELMARYLAGESASTIAKEMGFIGRNAVVGKLWRLGMAKDRPPRPAGKRSVEIKRRKPGGNSRMKGQMAGLVAGQWVTDIKRQTAPQRPSNTKHEAPAMKCVSIEGLSDAVCHWPMWPDDRERWDLHALVYCGADALGGGVSYCEFHDRIARAPIGRLSTWLVPQQ